ncbi:hypothetical protein AWH51_10695 [Clavibacter tessellarius]|uniref:Uncharacterized protein n=1 Tax=Clavibacter tessellarius TaxID=31965 RepID=A0A154V0R3_9MICO|nr:hypothetical protein AWH51_10695 [Clavibacter michiganensis subsp. tessellarius]
MTIETRGATGLSFGDAGGDALGSLPTEHVDVRRGPWATAERVRTGAILSRRPRAIGEAVARSGSVLTSRRGARH